MAITTETVYLTHEAMVQAAREQALDAFLNYLDPTEAREVTVHRDRDQHELAIVLAPRAVYVIRADYRNGISVVTRTGSDADYAHLALNYR